MPPKKPKSVAPASDEPPEQLILGSGTSHAGHYLLRDGGSTVLSATAAPGHYARIACDAEGARSGAGKEFFEDGSCFHGVYAAGKRAGQGELMMTSALLRGQFADGAMNGKGVMTSSWSVAEGEFAGNRLHGHAHVRYNNGSDYSGQFVRGLRHGYGEMTCQDGVYRGEWAADQREGRGQQTWVSGLVYRGEWAGNVPHGLGEMTLPSARKLSGQWEAGAFKQNVPVPAELLADVREEIGTHEAQNADIGAATPPTSEQADTEDVTSPKEAGETADDVTAEPAGSTE